MKNQAFIRSAENEATEEWADLYETYGVTLTRGWREALLKPADVKDYTTNDSRLEHGVRMVATSAYAKKKERNVQIDFLLQGASESDYLQKYEAFLAKMAYSGKILLKVPAMGRVFKIIYTDCQKYGDDGEKRGNFTLRFTEPNPEDRDSIS